MIKFVVKLIDEKMTTMKFLIKALLIGTGFLIMFSFQNFNLATEDGEELFEGHCRECHSDDFRKRKSAPALGNIHLYIVRDWLIDFIYNSQKMITSGDDLANCVYISNGKKTMPAFYMLNRKEIGAILNYIEKESKIQQIGREEINFPCN
jgi:mono/diheme cytochrome c family protein